MAIVYPTVGGLPQPSTPLDPGGGVLDTVHAAISAGDDDVVRNNRALSGVDAVAVGPSSAQRYAISGGDVSFVQIMGIGSATNAVGHVVQLSDDLDTAISASVKLDFTDYTGITHIIVSVGTASVSVWGET